MSETQAQGETTSEPQKRGEKIICLYPGCEREAVPGPKVEAQGRSGPPPRYCDNEDHNASSTFQELKRLEREGAATGGDA